MWWKVLPDILKNEAKCWLFMLIFLKKCCFFTKDPNFQLDSASTAATNKKIDLNSILQATSIWLLLWTHFLFTYLVCTAQAAEVAESSWVGNHSIDFWHEFLKVKICTLLECKVLHSCTFWNCHLPRFFKSLIPIWI